MIKPLVGMKYIHFCTQIMKSRWASLSSRGWLEKLFKETSIPVLKFPYIYTQAHWLKWIKKDTKIRIRKQTTPQVKIMNLKNLLGMITINHCPYLQPIWSLALKDTESNRRLLWDAKLMIILIHTSLISFIDSRK